jgi:hypothetical protein
MLCVHHIDHDPENNELENLILLEDRYHRSYHALEASAQQTLRKTFQQLAKKRSMIFRQLQETSS